jgi:hypothetical protein
MHRNKSIDELMRDYESALTEFGLGYSCRLTHLQRIRGLLNLHEQRGLEYLDDEVIAGYYRDIDERFYSGKTKKNNYLSLRRMVERFIRFVDTGEVKVPNMLIGCRQKVNMVFETIAEQFIPAVISEVRKRLSVRGAVMSRFSEMFCQGDLSVIFRDGALAGR